MFRSIRLEREALRDSALLATVLVGAASAFAASVQRLPLSESVSILYATSLIAGSLIAILIRQSLSVSRYMAMAVALLGLTVYAGFSVPASAGLITAICGGICDAIGNFIRTRLRNYNFRLVSTWSYLIAAPIALGAALCFKETVRFPLNAGTALGIAVYIASTAALSFLLLAGFRHVDLSRGTVLLSTQVLLALLLGALFLGEAITLQRLAGSLLVFVASTYSVIDAYRTGREVKSPQRELEKSNDG